MISDHKRRLILTAHTIDLVLYKDGIATTIEGDFVKELLKATEQPEPSEEKD